MHKEVRAIGKRKKPQKCCFYGGCGTPGQGRTADFSLRRRTLYPLSYGSLCSTWCGTVPHLGGERSILLSYGNTRRKCLANA